MPPRRGPHPYPSAATPLPDEVKVRLLAEEYFDADYAQTWMHTPEHHHPFSGRTPQDMINGGETPVLLTYLYTLMYGGKLELGSPTPR
jgi:hypothetical protein